MLTNTAKETRTLAYWPVSELKQSEWSDRSQAHVLKVLQEINYGSISI